MLFIHPNNTVDLTEISLGQAIRAYIKIFDEAVS